MRRTSLLALVFALAAGACGEAEEALPDGAEGGAVAPSEGNFTNRAYERNFVFAAMEGDSVFIVPWLMHTFESPDTVMREARGWLARGGVWEAFYAERWWTAPTRAPSRVLPHRGLRLLVGEGDAIDGVLFEQGARSLEVVLGEVEASWTGARGGSFDVLSGAAYLADQRVDGMVLDMARASAGETVPGGDWAFLLSGDTARFVFAGDVEYGGDDQPMYRGWGNLEDDGLQWPEVRMDWQRTEAFPPARRDVPVEWLIWSADGVVEGRLEAVSAEIQPGEGPGPLLPVRALYEVTGQLTTSEGDFPVHGILVHERR